MSAARALRALQEQRQNLENVQAVNDAADDDGMPDERGGLMLGENGVVVTYAMRREKLEAGMGRLVAANEDIRGELEEAARALAG